MKKVKVNFKKHFVCCFLLLAFMFSSKMSVAQEYSSLRAAFVATAAERAYSLNADENVTSALGTMGGTNATLTVTGNGYGVYGGNVARNLTVGGTNTLVVQNVGSLDAEGNVVKSWAEFRNTVFRVNANGTLAFKGKNVISGNEGAANTYLIYNNGGTISSFNADIIGNAYVNSLLYNLGTNDHEATVSDVNGSFKNNTLTSTANTSYGLIFNDAERKSATIGDINATMSGNTVSNTSGTLRGALIYNLAKIDAQIGNITGRMDHNTVSAAQNVGGALIRNEGNSGAKATITAITGSIDNNTITVSTGSTWGALIHNKTANNDGTNAEIGSIASKIEKNTVSSSGDITYGLIYNNNESSLGLSQIGSISGDISENDISNTKSAIYGGLIYNYALRGTVNTDTISSKMAKNIITGPSVKGGLIGNFVEQNADATATIGDITGEISENNVVLNSNKDSFGGLISNSVTTKGTATIDSISSKISNNEILNNSTGKLLGGLISNTIKTGGVATIDTISSEISNNKVMNNSTGKLSGGLISNIGSNGGQVTINMISSKISNNEITNSNMNDLSGGLIYNDGNYGLIREISSEIDHNVIISQGQISGGVFYNGNAVLTEDSDTKTIAGYIHDNYVESTAERVNGGVIYNAQNAKIDAISSRIENNYIKTNLIYEAGRVIANGAVINNFMGTVSIVDASILNNATNTTNIISNRGTMNVIADNSDVEFDGNVVDATIERNSETGVVTVTGGTKQDLMNRKTLNLYAKTGKTISFGGQLADDVNLGVTTIGGTVGGITYDGTVVFNDLVTQTEVNLEAGTLKLGVTSPSTNDSDVLKNVGTTTLNAGIVDVADGEGTNYNITKLISSSNVEYNIDLNVSNDTLKTDTFTLGSNSSGTIKLNTDNFVNNLSDETSRVVQIIKSPNSNTQLTWDGASSEPTWATAVMSSDQVIGNDYVLATTETTNDSIMFRGKYDTFRLWAELDTTDDKSFTFVDDTTYTLTQDSSLLGQKISIIGGNNELDLNNKAFLSTVADTQDITFKNITVTNASDITNSGALSFENASFDSDITNTSGSTLTLSANNSKTSSFDGDIDGSDYTLTLTGDATGTINLNGQVTANNATLDTVTLKLGQADTLENTVLNAASGSIDVADGSYTNYSIGKLISDSNARYNIDISMDNGVMKSDSFTLGENSTGTIHLGALSIDDDIEDDSEFILQIIHASGDNAPQLDYNSSSVLPEATAVMSSDDILAKGFGLWTTNTTNDSIKVRGLQDTFKAWANLETDDDKQFTFVSGSSYTIADTIDFNGQNKAEIINNGTLTNNGSLSSLVYTNNNTLTNNGTISGVINNSGTLNNNGVLSGQITNKEGATLSSDAEDLQPDDGVVYNDGTLKLSGSVNANDITESSTGSSASLVEFSSTLTNQGQITQDQVSIKNTANVTNEALITADILNNGTLTSSASNLSGTITNDGTLNLNAGVNNNEILNGTNSTGIVNFSGVTENNADVSAATIRNSGSAFVNSEGKTLSGNIENTGNMTANADDLDDTDSDILNNGVLNLQGGANTNDISTNVASSSVTLSDVMSNSGNIAAKEVTNTTTGSNVLSNTGSIEAETWTNNGAWTNTGAGEIEAASIINNGTLTTDANKLVASNDEVTNNGALVFTGGNNENAINKTSGTNSSVEFAGTTTNSGAIDQDSVTVSSTGNLTNTALISTTDNLVNNGTMTSSADNLSVGGEIENNNNLTLTGGTNSTNITGDGDLTLSGTVENTASIAQDSVHNTGTLTNTGEVTASVVNDGLINLNGGSMNSDITNNGTLDVNASTSLGAVSGSGTTNVNTDMELTNALTGNNVNVNGATLSGAENLGSDVALNAVGGTIDIANNSVNVKSAAFDENSSLNIKIDAVDDYGSLTAENMTVATGAKMNVTLAQGLVSYGEKATVQLLSANNSDFNNFDDVIDNNMYNFKKVDLNGSYDITLVQTAEEVSRAAGGEIWVSKAAGAWLDKDPFEPGTASAGVADELTYYAQHDGVGLNRNIKALAPTEVDVISEISTEQYSRLFRIVDDYLREDRDPIRFSFFHRFPDYNIWIKPYVGYSKIDERGPVAKLRSNSKGAVFAAEKVIDSRRKVGFGFHYDHSDVDAYRRDIDVSSWAGFIYGEYALGRWFVNGVAAYGYSDYTEEKFALGSSYKSDYDAHVSSLAMMTGYRFDNFVPEVGLRYYYTNGDSYKDTAGQKVSGYKTNTLRSIVGGRLFKDFGIFRPEAYFAITYDWMQSQHNTHVSLSNGYGYWVPSRRLHRLGTEASVGVAAILNEHTSISLSYFGAYRRSYQDHAGTLKLKYTF